MVFYESRQPRSAQKRLLEDWQRQKAVIFVLIEPNTQVNENIIDNSKRLLHSCDVERNKLCFRRLYLGNLRFKEKDPEDEILVVDNGSTDRTLAMVREYRGAQIFQMPNRIIAALRNYGASQARYRLLAFVDCDCLLLPN